MRKKTGIFIISVLLLCFALSISTVAFASDEAHSQTKDITFKSVNDWADSNGVAYYCEFKVEENAFYESALNKPIEWHAAEKNSTFEYLQNSIAVSLDGGEWRTVYDVNRADEANYSGETTYPFNIAKMPIVLQCYQPDVLRLYFHKNFVGDVRYELRDDVECEHTAQGWSVHYDTVVQPLGLTAVQGWDDYNGNWRTFNVYFSRSVLMLDNNDSIGYKIMDGADWRPLQDLIYVNGKSMKEINQTTNVDDWSFVGFPHTIYQIDDDPTTGWRTYDGEHYTYRTPVFIYSDGVNYMQVRLHNEYLKTLGDSVEITFAAGTYSSRVRKNAAGGMELVQYGFVEPITVTKNAADVWTPSRPYEKYENEEIIERKDIDFSQYDYERITVRTVSPIMEIGADKLVNGLKVKELQYFAVYFDKAVSNQYIPYASTRKNFLTGRAKSGELSLTQEQIDALYDYRIDISLNDYLKIDGKTVAERKAMELTDDEVATRVDLSGSSASVNAITVYIKSDTLSRLDPNVPHTFEVLAGFRTPLFGEVKENILFYYDPITKSWSTTDYDKASEWENTSGTNVDNTVKKTGCGCGGAAEGSVSAIAAAVIVTAVAMLGLRRKKESGL